MNILQKLFGTKKAKRQPVNRVRTTDGKYARKVIIRGMGDEGYFYMPAKAGKFVGGR